MIASFTSLLSVIVAILSLRSNGYRFQVPVMYSDTDCVDDTWEIHPIGTLWYDDLRCEMLECVFHEDGNYAEGYGCNVTEAPAGCQLISRNGSYPYCCPQVKC